jgi:uncharacterized membrane protein YeaQ/YmgE (transglycosylase-associated protein family)
VLLPIFVRVILRIQDPDGMLITLLLGIAGALFDGFLSVASGVIEYGDRTGIIAARGGTVTAVQLKASAVRNESDKG